MFIFLSLYKYKYGFTKVENYLEILSTRTTLSNCQCLRKEKFSQCLILAGSFAIYKLSQLSQRSLLIDQLN